VPLFTTLYSSSFNHYQHPARSEVGYMLGNINIYIYICIYIDYQYDEMDKSVSSSENLQFKRIISIVVGISVTVVTK